MRTRFGDFELDGGERLLLRAGEPVELEPKVFDCIELLVRHAGRLTPADRLRTTLWPDVHVGPGALRRVIAEARKALGDRGSAQALIRTRKGLGYVFTAEVEHEGTPALSRVPQPQQGSAIAWPFVGRAAELDALRAPLRQGGLCFVSGEAGAGKSTLLSALRGSSQDAHWLVGQCAAPEGLPAFWPFREVSEQIAKDAQLSSRLLPLVGNERRALRVIPELAGARPPKRALAISAEERFEACAAFAKALCRLAGQHPLRIVIEDVHWADDGSLLMLEALTRAGGEHPLTVFATYRPEAVVVGKALSALLARASGRAGTYEIALPALSQQDLSALLAAVGQSGSEAALLHRRTGGNALFVHELVMQSLTGDQQLSDQLPTSLQHIVAQRVGALPAPTQQLLHPAAVLGRDFDLGLLAQLADTTVDDVLGQLEPALAAGLLQPTPEAPDRLRFRHALLRDALEATLPANAKQRHPRDALRAYAQTPQEAARTGAQASHAFLAGANVPAGQRRELCERAGREAYAALAFDQAALHLGRAVRLLGERDHSSASAELILLWAKARWHADDAMEEVEGAFMQAAERARRAGSRALFAEAAIGFATGCESTLYFRSASKRPRALGLVQEAFDQLMREGDPEPGSAQAELCFRVATTACWMRGEAGALGEFKAAARLALRLAPQGASPFLQLSAAALRLVAEDDPRAPADPQFLTLLKDERLSLRQRIEAYVLWMAVCLGRGKLLEYEAAGLEIEQLAAHFPPSARFGRLGERLSAYVAIPLCARVTASIIRGEFAQAELALGAVAQQAQRLGFARTAEADNNMFYVLLQLLGYQGRSATLEPLLDQHLSSGPADGFRVAVAKAQFALERGDLTQARAHYQRLRESGFCPPGAEAPTLPKAETLVRIADLCRELGTTQDAELLYELLLPRADYWVHDGPLVCLGSFQRVLAELALQLGRRAAAEQHFEAALEANLHMPHRPEHLRTRLGQHRMLLAAGQRDQAGLLEAGIRSDAEALGMPVSV